MNGGGGGESAFISLTVFSVLVLSLASMEAANMDFRSWMVFSSCDLPSVEERGGDGGERIRGTPVPAVDGGSGRGEVSAIIL